MVEKKVNKYAIESLKTKASSHSKSLEILSGVQNQPVSRRSAYLKENTLTREDCQLLFKLRTKMLNVKTNLIWFVKHAKNLSQLKMKITF